MTYVIFGKYKDDVIKYLHLYDNNVIYYSNTIIMPTIFYNILDDYYIDKLMLYKLKYLLKLDIIYINELNNIIHNINKVKENALLIKDEMNTLLIKNIKYFNYPNILHYIIKECNDHTIHSLKTHIKFNKDCYHIIWIVNSNFDNINDKLDIIIDKINIFKYDNNKIKEYGGCICNLNYECKNNLYNIIKNETTTFIKNSIILNDRKNDYFVDFKNFYKNIKVDKFKNKICFFKYLNINKEYNFYFNNIMKYYEIYKKNGFNVEIYEIELFGINYFIYPKIINFFNDNDINIIDDVTYIILVTTHAMCNDVNIKNNI